MAYQYGTQDSEHRQLCRIAYGLVFCNYSIDDFLRSYRDYCNQKLKNECFRSEHTKLINCIGSDAFSVLSRKYKSKDDVETICNKLEALYRQYLNIQRTGITRHGR